MSKISKLIYIILFLALLLHPHFITGHIFSLPNAYAQSGASFLLVLIAYIIYKRHENDIARRDEEKNIIMKSKNSSDLKLNESFKYIGLANRRMSLFKGIISGALNKTGHTKKVKKDVLSNLLLTAVESIAKESAGLLRFVDINNQKTINEFSYVRNKRTTSKIKISNNLLCSNLNKSESKIDGLNIFYSSDKEAEIRCFLIINEINNIDSEGTSVLQSITDQARLFHRYLFSERE